MKITMKTEISDAEIHEALQEWFVRNRPDLKLNGKFKVMSAGAMNGVQQFYAVADLVDSPPTEVIKSSPSTTSNTRFQIEE